MDIEVTGQVAVFSFGQRPQRLKQSVEELGLVEKNLQLAVDGPEFNPY